MQKHSRQVLRSSRLKARLGGSVSLIVQDPDNIVKSAVRGFPSGREMKISSVGTEEIADSTETMPSEGLEGNVVGKILLDMMEGCPEGTKRRQKEGRTAEVFVDASLQGWGGVIVWKTGELEILGAAWPAGEDRHINILEADALGQTLKGIAKADHLSIWVDNTTVCGAFRKKMCVRSQSLNRCLITAIECLLVLKCSYSLA